MWPTKAARTGRCSLQNGRAGDFGVRRTRSDRDRAITELDLLGKDASDVDEAGRRGAAALHISQERLTAGEQHGALLGGESARFVERGGTVIDKVTHGRFSLVAAAAIALAPAAIALTML